MSLRALFDSIADAIRYVTSRSNKIIASNFPNEIRAIKDNMQEVEIVPSTEDQIKEGIFSKVTVEGSTNLVPENIKKDIDIFGVVGNAIVSNAKITNARSLFQNNFRNDCVPGLLALCIDTTNARQMFYRCDLLEEIDLSGFDTSQITDMAEMFYYCSKIESLDLNGFNTGKVTDMSYMFYNCNSLRSLNINNFDTSSVTDMSSMFSGCGKLENLELYHFSTHNVTDMNRMFYYCSALKHLDLSNFDTSSVTDMTYMFCGCSDLTEIDVSSFDTSNVETASDMFSNCFDLTSLDLSNFDFSKCTSVGSVLYSYPSARITDFKSFKNLGKAYTKQTANYSYYRVGFETCKKFTHESLMSIINNLYDLNLSYDVANGGTLYTQKLEISAENIAKLTADEIAIATNKGWSVS